MKRNGCLLMLGGVTVGAIAATVLFLALAFWPDARPKVERITIAGETSTAELPALSVSARAGATGELIEYTSTRVSSRKQRFAVHLTISNTSDTKKLDYGGWNDPLKAHLSDEHGNLYVLTSIGIRTEKAVLANNAIDVMQFGSLHPGDSIDDTLVFTAPVPTARKLTLHLSGDAFFPRQGDIEIPVELPE